MPHPPGATRNLRAEAGAACHGSDRNRARETGSHCFWPDFGGRLRLGQPVQCFAGPADENNRVQCFWPLNEIYSSIWIVRRRRRRPFASSSPGRRRENRSDRPGPAASGASASASASKPAACRSEPVGGFEMVCKQQPRTGSILRDRRLFINWRARAQARRQLERARLLSIQLGGRLGARAAAASGARSAARPFAKINRIKRKRSGRADCCWAGGGGGVARTHCALIKAPCEA